MTLGLALLALSAWLTLHFVMRRNVQPFVKLAFVPVSIGLIVFAWVQAISWFESQFETAGSFSNTSIVAMASLASEAVIWLYVDRRASTASPLAVLPVTLRICLIAVLCALLLEPVLSHFEEHSSQRSVAVVLDRSASMTLSDRNTIANPEQSPTDRKTVAENLLMGSSQRDDGLLKQLANDYEVRFFEYAQSTKERDLLDWKKQFETNESQQTNSDSPWVQTTNQSGALSKVDNSLLLDTLSGVVFLSDGCDHSIKSMSNLTQRFADKKVPIHSVIIGNQTAVKDAEVVLVQAPAQIFKGDQLTIRASIKADELQGKRTKINLLNDGVVIEQREIVFNSNRDRQTVVFETEPEEIGVHEYTVRLDNVAGEEMADNNEGSSRVWVSKDYIRMLIVEDRPRWEFRYLRNLFAGRDRSVFLQYVLLRPDRLAGVPDPPILHASAGRAFDDCQATALPKDANEWLKFDVIVLGDVAPDDLGSDVMQTLEKFVRTKAGTLIVISGARSMPHKYANTPIANLFPVYLGKNFSAEAKSPEKQYEFAVASSAKTHVIMQQSTDPIENEQIWNSIPSLYWRHPQSEAKPGANVLAYASDGNNNSSDREKQRKRALILWQRYGSGKVLQMCFDQTWRLRYGIGDLYHHKFWGQVLRWSIRDRLGAGTELVRMGTDRVLYQADDSVTIKARLMDKNRNQVHSDDTKALIYLGDELVHETLLVDDPEEGGLLLASANGFKKSGKYRVELAGPTVERLLELEQAKEPVVFTEFAVTAPEPSSEMSDVVADPTLANELANVSGGIVVSPEDAMQLLNHLGPKSSFSRDRWTVPLWNLWPVLVVFLLIASLEWIYRKAVGLI